MTRPGVDAAVDELETVEAFHPDDGKEVIEQEKDDHSRKKPGHQDDRRSKNVPEPLFHTE